MPQMMHTARAATLYTVAFLLMNSVLTRICVCGGVSVWVDGWVGG